MRSGKVFFLFLILAVITGCGGGGGSSSGDNVPPSPPPPPVVEANNVLALTVNGSLCSQNSYPNKVCVSVTVCTPGTADCQTINDVLLDTASYGLRIFKQALNVPLTQVTTGSGLLAECVQFGDGSSDWGPVQLASVILGNEPPVQVQIQLIDAAFATTPAPCHNAEQSPAGAGFNGILGLGFFAQDCGSVCASTPRNGVYYSCNGPTCSGTTVPLSDQVQNPVPFLPLDNNGLIIELPGVPRNGSRSVDGRLILGIGTQSNNVPSAVTAYTADRLGEFNTSFNGTTYKGFLDTGSNGLFFPGSGLPSCAAPNSAWFCPSSTTALSATNTAASRSPSGVPPSAKVGFEIANLEALLATSNRVFSNIGGNGTGQFIWGLPFYFGRNVYLGIDGKGSSLGTGPYWAY